MSLPKFGGKHGHPSTFSAKDLIAQARRLPRDPIPGGAILCMQDRLYETAVRQYRGRKLEIGFGNAAVLGGAAGGRVVAAGGFGIGAPAAVSMLEWLAAMGVKSLIAIGFAGGLHERQRAGDLVLCSRALRDEGASYHYLPAADFAEPDAGLAERLAAALTRIGCAYETGPSWTTDAPFRETYAEVERYSGEGILTVEMEAAGLFAASTHLGVACAAAFSVGDGPRDGKWQTDFNRKAMFGGLETLLDAAVAALAGEAPAGQATAGRRG